MKLLDVAGIMLPSHFKEFSVFLLYWTIRAVCDSLLIDNCQAFSARFCVDQKSLTHVTRGFLHWQEICIKKKKKSASSMGCFLDAYEASPLLPFIKGTMH